MATKKTATAMTRKDAAEKNQTVDTIVAEQTGNEMEASALDAREAAYRESTKWVLPAGVYAWRPIKTDEGLDGIGESALPDGSLEITWEEVKSGKRVKTKVYGYYLPENAPDADVVASNANKFKFVKHINSRSNGDLAVKCNRPIREISFITALKYANKFTIQARYGYGYDLQGNLGKYPKLNLWEPEDNQKYKRQNRLRDSLI